MRNFWERCNESRDYKHVLPNAHLQSATPVFTERLWYFQQGYRKIESFHILKSERCKRGMAGQSACESFFTGKVKTHEKNLVYFTF